MDNTEKSPNVLSLCSGYGGLEIGIERALGGINVLAHVEIEAFAIANLVSKMETGQMVPAPIWTDVKTFNAGAFRDRVDILAGGYPCQPFSAAGKRRGEDDPRHLWPYVRSIIAGCLPSWVFFENVEGHLSLGASTVLSDLEDLAYTVECGVFSAAEVGAPHQRKRVFILAHSEHLSRCVEQWIEYQKCSEELSRGYKLADPRSSKFNRIPESEKRRENRKTRNPGSHQWPARPGQPQYEWEEPRVVNSKSTKRGRVAEIGRPDGTYGQDGQTKPRLGRATNGPANRVDRLRLLGNGVVPSTAEKAFITLYRELTDVT